jgi:hypothetical protein
MNVMTSIQMYDYTNDDLFSHADIKHKLFFPTSDTQTNEDQTIKKEKMPK